MSVPSRVLVEQLVRDALKASLSGAYLNSKPSRPQVLCNVSARHMHITQENLEKLFGPGHQLEVHKALHQDGQFAAKETVTLVGPRRRIIPNLRILGPCRDITQIELAYTDAIQLGIDIPVRASGDIEGTPGGYIMGPKGMIEMPNGIIRAARHVHMHPNDAASYGVKHKDYMKMRVVSNGCTITFEDMLVRVDKSFKLEVHIDTDEGNACDIEHSTSVELAK
ncbi:MAG: phosphate propanoyltransferase [Verrucomicrobiota bacterium]|nr:phosphate propanoyltransferase [Verrucomicrobiota bacterium]